MGEIAMSEQFLIAGNGGPGSMYFGSPCKRPECKRPMTINGGNRNRFSMRCACGLRLMVFIAADPSAPLLIWRDECPEGMNFNDYLRTRKDYLEWSTFYRRANPSILGVLLANLPARASKVAWLGAGEEE